MDQKTGKESDLLVIYGTTDQEAYGRDIRPLVREGESYTSFVNKLVLKAHPELSVGSVLMQMRTDGVREVCARSIFLTHGKKWEEAAKEILSHREDFDRLTLTEPILDEKRMRKALAKAVLQRIRRADDGAHPLLLIGHGSGTSEDRAYALFLDEIRALDPGRSMALALLRGKPGADDAIKYLKAAGDRSILVLPLMMTYGFHARNDLEKGIGGQLKEAGLSPCFIREGIPEYFDPLA